MHKTTLRLALLVALCCLPLHGQDEPNPIRPIQDLARLFDYDTRAPLDVQEKSAAERDGAIVHDITYVSPKGGRVTAWLVTPKEKGPHPAILFGHWGPGERTEFLPEAMLYAQAGAVSLMIDYPWTRPAPWHRSAGNPEDAEGDKATYIQAVVDLRRGLDLLLSRADVDKNRVAYVGHSYGAQWGAILAAVDRRPRTCVLVGGVPDRAAIWLEADDPDTVEWRKSRPAGQLEKYIKVNADLDAIHYVKHAAPIPLLFQFAKHEQNFSEPSMLRYYQAASEPKSVKWYYTAHDLNDIQALLDRADWLRKNVAIGPLAPVLERKLKQMKSRE